MLRAESTFMRAKTNFRQFQFPCKRPSGLNLFIGLPQKFVCSNGVAFCILFLLMSPGAARKLAAAREHRCYRVNQISRRVCFKSNSRLYRRNLCRANWMSLTFVDEKISWLAGDRQLLWSAVSTIDPQRSIFGTSLTVKSVSSGVM